jgi:glycosyltransferase involved in cell wall biosynthesis/SAM-dependent methyltransferase
LRAAPFEEQAGCRVLSEGTAVSYTDGGEARVLELIEAASDLSSLSDELESGARTWPEIYHLSRSRANCLRALTLGRDMRVLDVGGGCGAIARYLGETCGEVDVLEPVAPRAAAARARTRDLPNVEVFVGGVEAVPAEPAYDLITVIGVLEYVAAGSAQKEPYLTFLRQLSALLRPGGRIIIAIENRLGVKYLAGAPEDHSGRPFDGIEGYPAGAPARTFSRLELQALLEEAGLSPTFHHAFPDYKLSRAVFSEDLFAERPERPLAWRVPRFPSPDWDLLREPWADEELLWRALVETGAGRHFGNSFVVVAARAEDAPVPAWEPGQLAAFYTTSRRGRFATETKVIRHTGNTRFVRRLLASDGPEVTTGDVSLRVENSDFIGGRPLLELLAEATDDEQADWLARWKQLVSDLATARSASMDLIASNVIVGDEGRLRAVDQEWTRADYGVPEVVERGTVWIAHHLAQVTRPDRWDARTVRELAVRLGTYCGLDHHGAWIDRALRREAEFQALVHDCDPGSPGWEVAVADRLGQLLELMDARLEDGRLGASRLGATRELRARIDAANRLVQQRDQTISELLAVDADKNELIAEMRRTLEEQEQALNEAGQQLEAIRSAFGYRILEGYRRVVRAVFPQRSWRGVPYRAVRKALKTVTRAPRRAAALGRRAGKARSRYGSLGMVTRSIDHLTTRAGNAVDPVRYALSVDVRTALERQPSRSVDVESPVINWVIPTFGEGGGLRTIFRMVGFLQAHGFRHRVYEMPVARPPRSSADELRGLLFRNFGVTVTEVSLDFENMGPADITFATSWHTAYPVAKFRDTHLKCYFVQDFEPYFAPVGTESAVTENTYRMGFYGVTAGRWLRDKLAADYGMECGYFDLSVDTAAYYAKEGGSRRKVFFYARPATPRRGFELGVQALEVFHRRNPGYEVVMAGGDVPSDAFSFPVTDVGYVSEDRLNDLYNESAAALVISLTNCSLLPLEIMATGCPVVTTLGDNNAKILPPDSAVLAVPSPHHLAQALEEAIKDPHRGDLIAAAKRYDWSEQADKVASILRNAIVAAASS